VLPGIGIGVCGDHDTLTATICKASDNSHIDINSQISCGDPTPVGTAIDHMNIPLPSLTGGTDIFYVPNTGLAVPGSSQTFGVSKITCSPLTVPIP